MVYLSGTDATDRRRPLSKAEAIRHHEQRARNERRSRGLFGFRTGRGPRQPHVTLELDPCPEQGPSPNPNL